MKSIAWLLFLALLIIFPPVFSQELEVEGLVVEAKTGEPVPGASVRVKDSSVGTITDINGRFTLDTRNGEVLMITFVGMLSREITLSDQSFIEIRMEQDIQGLEEVVVVGYGTRKKSDLTGSVVSIKTEELNEVPTTNLGEMIRTRAAGVEVSLGSARPGGSSTILIRGRNSLSGDNDPIFIVDGVPLTNIDALNSRDIQSIEVLKDASAQAIYGARASNGVILVTTKRGHEGKVAVSYDFYAGLQTVYTNFEVYDGEEWLELRREGYRSDNATAYPWLDTASNWKEYFPNENIADDVMLAALDSTGSIDWLDLVTDPAWMQQHNLNISGGSENTKISTTFGYFDQDGVRPKSGFKRGSFRLNIDQKVGKKLILGANTYYSKSEQQREAGSSYYDFIYLPPLAQPYDDNGNLQLYVTRDDRHRNPLFNNQESDRDVFRDKILLNIFADLEILPGLKYRLNSSIQDDKTRDYQYLSTNHERGREYAEEGGNGGEASKFNSHAFEYLLENILTYQRDFGSRHSLDLTLMQSANARKYESILQTTRNFNTDILGYDGIADGTVVLAPQTNGSSWSMLSYMGRLRYGLMNRYLLTFTARIDGSSVFGPDNKYALFPSVAFAWKIHEESFLQSQDKLSNLKLRISYGSIGNTYSPYQTQPVTDPYAYTFGGGETMVGYLPGITDFPNYGLRWETSSTLNGGLDFGFLRGRIYGTLEVYNTITTDLLVRKSIPSAYGYTEITANLGKTQNRGFEGILNAVLVSKPDLKWSLNLSYSRNRNKILEIDGTVDENGDPVNDVGNSWFIGEPINIYYNYEFDGIWQMEEDNSLMPAARPGDVKLVDQNGDSQITPEDDRIIYYRDPDWYGTFSTNLSWKGIDLIAVFYAKVGGIRSNPYLYNGNYGAYKPAFNSVKVGYWTPENPSNKYARPYVDGDQSQHKTILGYQDASYFRLRTLTVGYNFPYSLTEKLRISNLRIYFTGTNLWTKTEYLSYSPEANPESYPEGKTYTFGINVTF